MSTPLSPCRRWALAAAALSLLPTGAARAQTLYGLDGAAGTVHEFTAPPGGPCPAPLPAVTPAWPYALPGPCPFPPPGPTPPPGPGSFGDIAADRLTDTVYVTDGFLVQQYAETNPLAGTLAGTPIDSFPIPPLPGLGLPILGMGMDATGLTTGVPTLYITDGLLIAGITPPPPGSCLQPPVVVPPFLPPFPMPPGVLMTDITVDPSTASLLVCETAGNVLSLFPGGGPGPYGPFPVAGVGGCPLGPGLEGLAIDPATTPSVFGFPPALYVTDGFTVAYVDVLGAPALPTMYTPVPCFPTPAPINGLACSSHSNPYGGAPGAATLTTFGASTSPGPTYGITLTTPVPAFHWLVYGTNLGGPGTGFFCPPLTAVGNPLFVDLFTPPGTALPLLPTGPGATSLPLPIPPGLPAGLELHLQAFQDQSPGAPGGPWLSTNPVEVVITAP